MQVVSILLLLSVLPPVPGKLSPDLIPMLDSAMPGEKLVVIVHMNTEYPYDAVKGMHYTEICQVFKNVAENSQRDIVKYVRSLPSDKAEMCGQFWIFNGFHLKATRDVIQELAKRDDVWFICYNATAYIIYENGKEIVSPNVAEWNIQIIQADSCWIAGFSGAGIILGHVDTGVLTTHAALAGKWLSPYWIDGVNGQASPYDDNGHGTHTMGTICGGDGFGPFTDDVGVAYGAQYIPTKGFNSGGSGTYAGIDTCMNYLANLKSGGVDIRAIGNSWGTSNGSDLHWWTIVLNWKTLGVLPVFSNGNNGPGSGTVGSPGSYPLSIGIGSTTNTDAISSFSSRGPAPDIDPINNPAYWYYSTWSLLKPDVSAPGENVRSSYNDGGYTTLSGTSMASPHVTGSTAVLLQKNPTLSVLQLYDLFRNYCDQPAAGAPYPNMNYGWGRINLWRSLINVPAGGMPAKPTIVSPFNYARMPVVQPQARFYSTDPDNNDIRYRVFWDDNVSFSSPDSATTADYPSGNIVTFTFPSALTNGVTYWWRVKCTDPTGTGYWSQYSESRSFTIGTSLPANSCSWYQTTNAQFVADSFFQTYAAGDSIVLNGIWAYDTLAFQNFESGSMPAGWTVVNGNSDSYLWTVGTTTDLSTYTPPDYGSYYAYYSDDDAGSGILNNNEELISPKFYVGAVASGLEIQYGYGFRLYQSGEKYRVKMRKKTGGTWSAWQDLKVYVASANGTETINLDAYLPADSMQFDWFYSDSTSSSHWGWACACDNVFLRRAYLIQYQSGNARSTTISFHDLSTVYARINWGNAVWRKATAGDSVGIQVEYSNGSTWQLVPNSALPGNSTGFFTTAITDSIDLHTLDTLTYGTLRLRGLLYRKTKSPSNPALLDWEVGNLAGLVGIADNGKNIDISGPIFRISPTVARTSIKISFALANPELGAELTIYDATGRVIKDIELDKNTLRIFNEVTWNADDNQGRKLSAGIYFVRFKTSDYNKTLKAILLR